MTPSAGLLPVYDFKSGGFADIESMKGYLALKDDKKKLAESAKAQ